MTSSWKSCTGDVAVEGESGVSARLPRDMADRELLPDRTDAASDLSPLASPLLSPAVELRGLSVLDPGILERKAPRMDLLDSLVSAFVKEG